MCAVFLSPPSFSDYYCSTVLYSLDIRFSCRLVSRLFLSSSPLPDSLAELLESDSLAGTYPTNSTPTFPLSLLIIFLPLSLSILFAFSRTGSGISSLFGLQLHHTHSLSSITYDTIHSLYTEKRQTKRKITNDDDDNLLNPFDKTNIAIVRNHALPDALCCCGLRSAGRRPISGWSFELGEQDVSHSLVFPEGDDVLTQEFQHPQPCARYYW